MEPTHSCPYKIERADGRDSAKNSRIQIVKNSKCTLIPLCLNTMYSSNFQSLKIGLKMLRDVLSSLAQELRLTDYFSQTARCHT